MGYWSNFIVRSLRNFCLQRWRLRISLLCFRRFCRIFICREFNIVVIGIFIILIWTSLNHSLTNRFKIDRPQKFFQFLTFTLKLNKELLCMTTSLSAGACSDMLLDASPFFTVKFKCLNKSEVFIQCPPTVLLTFRVSTL